MGQVESTEANDARVRRGVALPLLLLLLLALTLLAHGALVLAEWEVKSSGAFLHAVQATQLARSALTGALDHPAWTEVSGAPGLAVPLLQEEFENRTWRRAAIRWLDTELFIMEGWGGSRQWAGERRAGAVGWRLDPATRISALLGGIEVGGEFRALDRSRITGDGFVSLPQGWEEADCSPWKAPLDSLFPAGVIRAVFTHLEGSGGMDSVGVPGLGFLTGGHLLDLFAEEGERSSEAISEGISSEGGLGCPGSGGPWVLGTRGSLKLEEGWRCGLLVVEGDLILEGEGLFQGVALVGGDLLMAGSWTFQGIARVGGSLTLRGSAVMDASGCAALRTLHDISRLRDPLLLPGTFHDASF